jgi:hypothetical protein
MLGSFRWLNRTRSIWEVIFVLFLFVMAWYAVLKLLGGSQSLVPLAILVSGGGFAVGRFSYVRRRSG